MSHPRPGPGDDRATRAHGAALPRSVPAPRTGSRDFPKQPALASKAYVTAEGERAEGMACADAVGGTTYNGEAQGHASGRGLFGGARLSAELLGCIFKRMSSYELAMVRVYLATCLQSVCRCRCVCRGECRVPLCVDACACSTCPVINAPAWWFDLLLRCEAVCHHNGGR